MTDRSSRTRGFGEDSNEKKTWKLGTRLRGPRHLCVGRRVLVEGFAVSLGALIMFGVLGITVNCWVYLGKDLPTNLELR